MAGPFSFAPVRAATYHGIVGGQIRKQDRQLIGEFAAWLDSRGGAERTVKSYRLEIESLAKSQGALLDVGPHQLMAYFHERGGGPATRARRHNVLTKFFRDYLLDERGLIADTPLKDIPRPAVAKVEHPEVVHVDSSLSELPDRVRLIAEFVLETGLRLGEAESIKPQRVVGSQVRVTGRGGKRRVENLSPHARNLLQQLGGVVFIESFGARSVQRMLTDHGLSFELLRRIAQRSAPSALPLHPLLDVEIRRLVDTRESEEAVFTAFKEVEIRVRELAGFPANVLGMNLMHLAFRSDGGPLTDASVEDSGERAAMMELFAGAVGAFKSPSSHRRVTRPAAEITELLALANQLMRELDRVDDRLKRH